MATQMQNKAAVSRNLEIAGLLLIRYGVVLILFWIGLLKFTSYEAEAIKPLVENSPFMSWMYSVLSVQAASNVIGVIEVVTALLMAARPWSALASAIGSAMAVITFLLTLSFLLSTPPAFQKELGFPFLSPAPGQFLLKDILLLGGAVWSLGESLKAMMHGRNGRNGNHF